MSQLLLWEAIKAYEDKRISLFCLIVCGHEETLCVPLEEAYENKRSSLFCPTVPGDGETLYAPTYCQGSWLKTL